MKQIAVLAIYAVSAAAVAGCGGLPAAPPPKSTVEYERMRLKQRTDYPRHTVVMYNIQRVLDPSVSGPDRAKSLELVEQLGQENPAIRVELARVLGAKETPPELRKAVLAMLLKRDHPDLAEHVVRVLAELEPDDPMRATVLDWLTRHPTEGVLAEVVALWAREPDADGYNRRYERVVERISGQNWATALLEGLNSDGFTARGSAIEVLSRRLGAKELARRIRQMSPRTVSVLAMQTFLTEFDYLPESAEQLLSVVSLYRSENDDIDDASKEYRLWNQQHGYVFKVRDFHLLKSLAKDPLRPNLRRSHLILTIGRRLKELKHVRHNAPGRGRVNQGNFWVLSHKLTMADLWNVNLLSEMLARKRVQMALGIVADRDLSNTRTAMGGLVVYQNGQAEAMLYSQAADAPTNDLTYVPNKAAVLAGRDALCRFQGHFEKINNALRAGPGPQEIRHAEKENYYGLILTSLSQDSFAAHYYNPDGEVVSLGVYPFAGGRTAR